ncbi:hypothetical protein [Paenibacillus riograndensis]|nr:hypothetical protein [Paenibacillus riograndensis]
MDNAVFIRIRIERARFKLHQMQCSIVVSATLRSSAFGRTGQFAEQLQ